MRQKPNFRALVRRAKGGDDDAVRALVGATKKPVTYVLRSKLASHVPNPDDDAEEIFFLAVYQAIDSYRENGGRSFKNWVVFLANHIAIDRSRAAVNRRTHTA